MSLSTSLKATAQRPALIAREMSLSLLRESQTALESSIYPELRPALIQLGAELRHAVPALPLLIDRVLEFKVQLRGEENSLKSNPELNAFLLETRGILQPIQKSLEGFSQSLLNFNWAAVRIDSSCLPKGQHDVLELNARKLSALACKAIRTVDGILEFLNPEKQENQSGKNIFLMRERSVAGAPEICEALGMLSYCLQRAYGSAIKVPATGPIDLGVKFNRVSNFDVVSSILKHGILNADRVHFELGNANQSSDPKAPGIDNAPACAVMARILPAGLANQQMFSMSDEERPEIGYSFGVKDNPQSRILAIDSLVQKLTGEFGPFSLLGVGLERASDNNPWAARDLDLSTIKERIGRIGIAICETAYQSRKDIENDKTIFSGWDHAYVPSFDLIPAQRIVKVLVPEKLLNDELKYSSQVHSDKLQKIPNNQVAANCLHPKREGVVDLPNFSASILQSLNDISRSISKPKIILFHAIRL